MQGFTSRASAQHFPGTHAAVFGVFSIRRHLLSCRAMRILRALGSCVQHRGDASVHGASKAKQDLCRFAGQRPFPPRRLPQICRGPSWLITRPTSRRAIARGNRFLASGSPQRRARESRLRPTVHPGAGVPPSAGPAILSRPAKTPLACAG